MKIHLQRFLNDARFDINDLHIFDVSKPGRQWHAGGIALALSLKVEIGRSLQSVARTGHLRETRSGREQYRGEYDPIAKKPTHRTPPVSFVNCERESNTESRDLNRHHGTLTSPSAGDAVCTSMWR